MKFLISIGASSWFDTWEASFLDVDSQVIDLLQSTLCENFVSLTLSILPPLQELVHIFLNDFRGAD